MFIYDLATHTFTGKAPFKQITRPEFGDVIEQAGDAVIIVFPIKGWDSFNFVSSTSQLSVKGNRPSPEEALKTNPPIFLDPVLTQLSVRQGKDSHVGMAGMVVKDPENQLLRVISPGDHMVIWMFDNHVDAQNLRDKLARNMLESHNEFNSGLKFVGKVFSVRSNIQATAAGHLTRNVSINAVQFSEFDTSIYYDPLLITNFDQGRGFFQTVYRHVNGTTGLPQSVGGYMAASLSAFLGDPPQANQNDQSTNVTNFNDALLVPQEVASILGVKSIRYMDTLRAYLGTQEYRDTYSPIIKSGKRIFFTNHPLKGFISPVVNPFNNVPVWGILKNFSIPAVNEMYTTLRVDHLGKIMPTFVCRQIPFNTMDFYKTHKITCTPFLTLPRWKLDDTLVTQFDTGKSNSMRVNFVQIQPVDANFGNAQFSSIFRGGVHPYMDSTDIKRNGLYPYIDAVNAVFIAGNNSENPKQGPDPFAIAQSFTALVTDRLMGSHLKLSGSMVAVGFQEPICPGDNLEYDGIVYHIESVEHRLTVNAMTGMKSFSTNLALSNGVPATGPVLPEIVSDDYKIIQVSQKDKDGKPIKGKKKFITSKTGSQSSVGHSSREFPAANFEGEDK